MTWGKNGNYDLAGCNMGGFGRNNMRNNIGRKMTELITRGGDECIKKKRAAAGFVYAINFDKTRSCLERHGLFGLAGAV